MQIIIPAAGAGSRFKEYSDLPKPYIDVNGEPMIVAAVRSLNVQGKYIFILPEHVKTSQVQRQLLEVVPDSEFVVIDYVTEGAVQTALLAEQYLDPKQPLLMANCDQIMKWCGDKVIGYLSLHDASVVTVVDHSPKHSYVEMAGNKVVRINEKERITGWALVGIHYWRLAEYFLDSAKRLIADDNRSKNEFYVSTTYNYLIENGLDVDHVTIPSSSIRFIGIPEDLEKYLNESKQTI